MKKAVVIFGLLAILFVAGVTAFAWYILNGAEYAANSNRTQAARQNRWKKKDPLGEETTFEEVKPSSNGQHTEETQENKTT